jgi:hypothetical protein
MLSFISIISTKDSLLEALHCVVNYKIIANRKSITTHTLIDYRATELYFTDKRFTSQHSLAVFPLSQEYFLEILDSYPVSFGNITHLT